MLLEFQQNILSRHLQSWVGRATANEQFLSSVYGNCFVSYNIGNVHEVKLLSTNTPDLLSFLS